MSVGFSGLTYNNIVLALALQGQINMSFSSTYLSDDNLKAIQTQTDKLMNTNINTHLKGYLLPVPAEMNRKGQTF